MLVRPEGKMGFLTKISDWWKRGADPKVQKGGALGLTPEEPYEQAAIWSP